ncbi:MAG TPA: hypothetical protein VLS47_10135 [Gallionella sp.]|nr:hypothetical protein [Gallionella sp.]
MSITSVQKTWILVGVLVIAGGAAFVYFDPMDLDLLGLKTSAPVVVQPAAPARAAPKAAVAPVKAPVAAAPVASAPAAPVAAPPQPAPVATTPPVEAFEPTMQPAMKPAPVMTAGKPERPRNLDLRHCLELETNAAIAKCAGE